MGWFDDQIKQRIENDNETFSQAFSEIAGAVTGKSGITAFKRDTRKQTMDAVEEILQFYNVPSRSLPDNMQDMNEILEYLLHPSGIMHRNVEIKDNWYKNGIGPMLAQIDEDTIVALIPSRVSGYIFLDPVTGKRSKVNKKQAQRFLTEAVVFYKPFPLRELTAKDLFAYVRETLSPSDYFMIIFTALAVTLIGMLSAYANNIVFGKVVESGRMQLFYPALLFLVGITLSTQLIKVTQNLAMSRINTKSSVSVQAAAMMRLMSLPADFFKSFGVGDLASRVRRINDLCSTLVSVVFTTGFSTAFSLTYFIQIFHYTPALTMPAIGVMLVTVLFFSIASYRQMKLAQKEVENSSKESGLVYSLLSGIQKIKLSGAEKRAFSKWADIYRNTAKLRYNPPLFLKLTNVIIVLILSFGTVVLYYLSVRAGVSSSEYMTFNVSYGMVNGALLGISGAVMQLARVKPMYKSVEPILKAVPEIAQSKKVVTRLSGSIELNNISFRYTDNMPMVIDNLSLKIRPGQYVAIVGTTGCGKSTLMRLMLGFETPQKGAIYYDGKDLNTLDLKSLRRNIGTVLQNSKLFSGDVFSNIVISAPWLKRDDAWAAAEMAGMADDIKNMPMGMSTIISEGSGGISGGQRQRLMIARAIAPKPKILMFDEATSALDNLTQKTVSNSLESLKCTRIVIAHRLSTIMHCDRIIVLDKGKIAEDGTYEELIAKGGLFAELVERQQLNAVKS